VKKLIIITLFLISPVFSPARAEAQYYHPYFGNGFGSYGYYYPYYGSAADKALYATYQFFGTTNEVWSTVQNNRALEGQIQHRQNNLENYKTLQRAQTGGIPPFAEVGPNGRPRSPKITWQDVESIR
jgi:hypothetical protein